MSSSPHPQNLGPRVGLGSTAQGRILCNGCAPPRSRRQLLPQPVRPSREDVLIFIVLEVKLAHVPSFLSSKILEVQGSRLKMGSLLSSILGGGRGLYPGSPKEMPPPRASLLLLPGAFRRRSLPGPPTLGRGHGLGAETDCRSAHAAPLAQAPFGRTQSAHLSMVAPSCLFVISLLLLSSPLSEPSLPIRPLPPFWLPVFSKAS